MRRYINLVESFYAEASPEQLRELARAHEGVAAKTTLTADDFDWHFDPAFPVAKLVGAMPDGDWLGWYEDELAMDREDEMHRDWDRLSQEEIQEPIVVSFEPDGGADIWDGWHRTAGQIVRGAQTIPAIVGTERAKVAEGADKLELPDIEVGDEVLVGKFKNRKATVKGFTKDDHNQPVLKTTKGDQKLFKPRLSKLMTEQTLEEGLIAIPPKMLDHVMFLLTYHVLWRMRDRFEGKQKELPEQYAAFKKLVANFGETLPPEPYKLDGPVSVTRIPVTLDGMPSNYLHLKPKTDSIFFAIDWRPGKMNGAWRQDKLALIVYPCSLDYIERYPTSRSHPDDLEVGLDTLAETISHELRHMVQFVLLGDYPEQLKMKADYKSHGSDYFTSPVEFDPTIGSAVQEFLHLWRIYGESSSSKNVKMSQAIRQFTGMATAPRFSTFETPKFFAALKKTAPERYRVAVKKFLKELQARLSATPHP